MLNALLQRIKVGQVGLTPPQAQAGRHGVAIVLVVRNEERHIGEWARFHRLAGIRHVFVYDDDSTGRPRSTGRHQHPGQ